MKRIVILVLVAVLIAATMIQAQVITLNTKETVAVPTVDKIQIKNVNIDINGKSIEITYRFLDATNNAIPKMDTMSSERKWKCFDKPAIDAGKCTGIGEPYECCTDVGKGNNCFTGDLCWTNSYSYIPKAEEADKSGIGGMFIKRIWDLFKVSILTAGNDGTLPQDMK